MQLISKFNKGFRFLLCVIDIYSKYAWVVPLKDKKGVSIINAFQNILKKSNRRPNKIWVDKDSEFYNRSMKSWLEKNDIEMYSTHNERKSVVAEVGDRVRISKYKNNFAKGYAPNWLEEIFVIKKIKKTVPWTYVINDLNGEDITGTFYENELQRTNQEEFRIEKVIKKKGGKLYVKWKGYDNLLNSWIDEKDLKYK